MNAPIHASLVPFPGSSQVNILHMRGGATIRLETVWRSGLWIGNLNGVLCVELDDTPPGNTGMAFIMAVGS